MPITQINFPFAEPFFQLTTSNVNEGDGSAVVVVELRGTEIAFDLEVTVQTIGGGTATGNTAWDT